MKDLDFLAFVKEVKIKHEKNSKKHSIIDILSHDADFFAQTNIIDYSLLLGVINNPVEIH